MFGKFYSNTLIFAIISLAACFLGSFLLVGHISTEVFAINDNSTNTTKTSTPIKHVIVISQGKRSFDNYFGTFPGVNGFPANITIPINPFPPQVVKFTVAAWFNTNNSLSENGFLINKGGIGVDSPGKNMNYGIWMNNKGNIIAGFETKNGTDYIATANGTYNNGKWHHVIVSYNGNSDLSLFVDGRLSGTNKTQGAIPDSAVVEPLRIGANSYNPDSFFVGLIDEIRIWNRTLHHSEILQGYYNDTFDTAGQLIYLPYEDTGKKNNSDNMTSASKPFLNGMYLNGSSYEDIKLDAPQHSKSIKPFHLNKTNTEAPYDGSKAYDISYNNGLMNGFFYAQNWSGVDDPNIVMGYYNKKELPYYWKFATKYVLADNFFTPTMETGLINQEYLYAAGFADSKKNISFPGLVNLNKTIFDELQAKRLPWKVYVEDYDPSNNYSNNDVKRYRYINLLTAIPRFVDNKTLNSNIVDLPQYFRDLAGDNFPAVSYIVAQKSEESAPRDVTSGQKFVSSLVLALMKSKHWNDSLFIITYREPGGWYDHVAPPVINGNTFGFRVPTLIISPYAKEGYVDNTLYDVTSILKFIEYNFGLQPLSTRDANASNMLNAFDFGQPPREPLELNFSAAQSAINQNKKIGEYSESIPIVNLIYLIVLVIIPIAAAVIWILNKRYLKLDLIHKSDHRH